MMATEELVADCPAEFMATAVSEWLPVESAAVFSEKLNGALVTATPEFTPSTWNCTLMVFAEAAVVTFTVPATAAPEAGDVIDTVSATGAGTKLPLEPVSPPHAVQISAGSPRKQTRRIQIR